MNLRFMGSKLPTFAHENCYQAIGAYLEPWRLDGDIANLRWVRE